MNRPSEGNYANDAAGELISGLRGLRSQQPPRAYP